MNNENRRRKFVGKICRNPTIINCSRYFILTPDVESGGMQCQAIQSIGINELFCSVNGFFILFLHALHIELQVAEA